MSSVVLTVHPAARPAALRLTARGRAVLLILVAAVLLVVVGVGVLALGGTAAAGDDVHPLPVTSHVVMPGETLWAIARRLDPAADPRDVIAQIVELNRLPSADVPAGLVLALPARA